MRQANRGPRWWLSGVVLLICALTVYADEDVYLLEVPDYAWFYGCMGTATGNLIGYWDRHGFPDFYTGKVNRGVAPLNTVGANSAITSMWVSRAGADGRPLGVPGHFEDYYRAYDSPARDPYVDAGRVEHEPDCIADFIGMNQFKWQDLSGECRGNIDGYCFVCWDREGGKRVNYQPNVAARDPEVDVQSGLRAWTKWRGYEADVFTQLVDFNPNVPAGQGFTFADMKAEIDAGYPVLLFLQNYDQLSRTVGIEANVNPNIHAMLAFGYYRFEGGGDYVYYRDSWAQGSQLTVWGPQDWQANMPVRGVIGFHPRPRIRGTQLSGDELTLVWDGPAGDLYDAFQGSTTRVHGYVVEQAAVCDSARFEAVSPVLLTNRFTITNSPTPSYFRLKLVRP